MDNSEFSAPPFKKGHSDETILSTKGDDDKITANGINSKVVDLAESRTDIKAPSLDLVNDPVGTHLDERMNKHILSLEMDKGKRASITEYAQSGPTVNSSSGNERQTSKKALKAIQAAKEVKYKLNFFLILYV